MIQGFGPGGPGAPGRQGPGRTQDGDAGAREYPGSPGQQQHAHGQPHVHRTTFTSGPFGIGTTSVTIVSGPMPAAGPGQPPGGLGVDPFQAYAQPQPTHSPGSYDLRVTTFSMTLGANQRFRIFSNVLRDMGPPNDGQHEDHEGHEGPGNGPPPGFARSLHDILSLLNPANARAGDAVYSQEALDRIITGLMEANPQSNAAPPATDEALRNLERKPVNKEMLEPDGKAECTICIDEMKEGDSAMFLPCKHWFHEECVVLWLKEHNTCPICRTPIEKSNQTAGNSSNENNGGSSNNDGGNSNNPHGPTSRNSPNQANPTPPGQRPNIGMTWSFSTSSGWGASSEGAGGPQSRPVRYSRPPSQSQSRLNEALRNLSSIQREARDRDRDRDRASTSGFSYDTSRLQRRSSHSPTSPRAYAPGEQGARMRQRSPSQSSHRSAADGDQGDQRRPSGHGPISWLRDRFSGGSNNGSSRDARRE